VIDVARMADAVYPKWNMIKLQYVSVTPKARKRWARHPYRRIVPMRWTVDGAVANLYSRAGLRTILDKVYHHESEKFDCSGLGLWIRCISDSLLTSAYFDGMYSVVPPMFSVTYNSGSTGVRCTGDCANVTRNDHEYLHEMSFLRSLQWAIEGQSRHRKYFGPFDWTVPKMQKPKKQESNA